MKALFASALTALVLVTTAWASNVTPAQLAGLTHRVTKLEKTNTQLAQQVACLRAGWNAQRYVGYATLGSGSWPTKSGNLTVYAVPNDADGVASEGWLVAVDATAAQC